MPAATLNNLADLYTHDGDVMECVACKRRQQVRWHGAVFPHRDGCQNAEAAPLHPWQVLHEQVSAALAAPSLLPD